MANRPDVSVIIVSYNTRELLRACLCSLLHQEGDCPRLEIVVVDNASTDGSAAMVASEFPQVRLIANHDNRGFGAACNQGLAVAQGRYALILNADVRAEPSALSRLVAFMDTHPSAVACGGQLRYPDGRVQPSCARELTLWWVFCEQTLLAKLFPRTRLFGGYWRTEWDFSSTIETEQVMGACLMLRRGAPIAPPPEPPAGVEFPTFDEAYFLYCEDSDLCYRLRLAGGKIYYVHDAVFIHHLGASGEAQRAEMVCYYNRGKVRYFRKFHGAWQAMLCRQLNRLGALLRVLIGAGGVVLSLGKNARARQYAANFWKVLWCS
ncbi:MAG: glycosyltransferase family 2 protein [Fimbriimonadales bacterium]|nr:glycosyltransferase family 2 protein [Fimbriimonadales bacterium]MDW8052432.1 glycosyltransferase family 2 protein [Armatimonadota bacterium]